MKISKRTLQKLVREELDKVLAESMAPHGEPTYEMVIKCLQGSMSCLSQAALAYAKGEMEAVMALPCVQERMQCIQKAAMRPQY